MALRLFHTCKTKSGTPWATRWLFKGCTRPWDDDDATKCLLVGTPRGGGGADVCLVGAPRGGAEVRLRIAAVDSDGGNVCPTPCDADPDGGGVDAAPRGGAEARVDDPEAGPGFAGPCFGWALFFHRANLSAAFSTTLRTFAK